MNDTIKAIAASICLPNGDCVKCDVLITATEIYNSHVKPLEEALAKAQAQNYAVLAEQAAKLLQGVTTGITGDAGSFHVDMCITCPHCGLVMDAVEEATAHDAVCEKHPAVIRAVKVEADKAELVAMTRLTIDALIHIRDKKPAWCRNECNPCRPECVARHVLDVLKNSGEK